MATDPRSEANEIADTCGRRERILTVSRGVQAADQVDQRRLSGAGASDDASISPALTVKLISCSTG